MMKNMLFACVAIIAVIMPGTGAVAADAGNVRFNADKTIAYAHPATHSYTPYVAPSHLTPIFDNLASRDPKGVYFAYTGYTLGGPQSPTLQLWLASSFTPAANANITEVAVAVGYFQSKKNEVVIKLYADANGVPGAQIWSHAVTVPAFGSCCTVAKVHDRAGIPVVAGTRYWLGVVTQTGDEQFLGAWSFDAADQVNTILTAENTNGEWTANTSLPNVAFAVYGQ